MKKKCEDCGKTMKSTAVEIEGAISKAKGWTCNFCGNFDFVHDSGKEVLKELRKSRLKPLSTKQKIAVLGNDLLCIPLNKTIIKKTHLIESKLFFTNLFVFT